MKRVSIGNIEIGDGLPPLLVAEIGLNHNGSIDLAHQHIDLAAKSGAHMVKFQKRHPADLATADFLDAPLAKCPLFGKTQRQLREKLELSEAQLQELKVHATELNLLFSMSVFDVKSLDVALNLDMQPLKIASHSITNIPFLTEVAKTGKPIFFSMAAASWDERDVAYSVVKNNPLVILHCVSSYPCSNKLVKLDTIHELESRYNCVVGYSGHEMGFQASVIAVVLGAKVVEKHFTLNKAMVGLDHKISLEPNQFADMARRISEVVKFRGVVTGIADEEKPTRANYHVSVCSKRKIRKGEVIKGQNICCKQPLGEPGKFFTGLEVARVIGKEALRDLESDCPIPVDAIG